MSGTPIAERLAAELGSPWPSRWRITGWLYEDFGPVGEGPEAGTAAPVRTRPLLD